MVTNMDELLNLENSYKGQKVFIVATGPSLAYRDLSFLEKEITIGLNMSSLLLDQWGIAPTFNVFADKFIIPYYEKVYQKLVVNSPTKKLIVASACETFPSKFKDSNTYFSPLKLSQEVIKFSENPLVDGFWRGKTVAYDALQLAFFLGFDEINILGMDLTSNHNWGNNGHAFEIQKHPEFIDFNFPKTENHIIQRGFPGHPEYRNLIIEYMREAKTRFEKAGKRVIIDSRSSLDVFEKEDILRKYGYVPKVVAFVPAKGTSQRVENKNVKLLGDKALFLHILDTLISSYTINEVYLDSESSDLFSLAQGRKHIELLRPKELASNKTNGNQLLFYEASQVPDADIYVQALPTGPFLSREIIDAAVFQLIKNKSKDSVFTATMNKLYLWNSNGKPINYDINNIPNSFNLPDTIVEAMNLYVIRKETLQKTKRRIGDKPFILPIPQIESLDINTLEDFKFAEIVYRGLRS
ncbi:MAG: cytidylyltransferase domain-containing protein [Candidatus Nanoarchaeia archaeon]